MTGARIPDGLDRVIPVEQTERVASAARIRLLADVERGQNVRTAGSDVQRGETVLAAGSVLGPHHLMLLAALGCGHSVRYSAPACRRAFARVVNSSTIRHKHWLLGKFAIPMALFLLHAFRWQARTLYISKPLAMIAPAFELALQRALDAGAQVIVSSGAVSMGRYDFRATSTGTYRR